MAKGYREEQIRCKIKSNMCSDIGHLYQNPILNYQGNTIDTKQLYTEVAASEILNNIECLDKISVIQRTNPYRIISHQDREIPDSNREEEKIAIALLKKSYLGLLKDKSFGKVFDYQVPLKQTRKDKGVGKIDLVSISDDGNKVYLLELKRSDSKESMLRCVLEAYTYSKQLDSVKFKNDYSGICAQEAVITPAPLVFFDKWQYKEYYDGRHPRLRELMEKLGNIKPFFITPEDWDK